VLEHPEYYKLRERLIEFLEVHAHKRKSKPLPPGIPAMESLTPVNALRPGLQKITPQKDRGTGQRQLSAKS
jgi:hypothetical protein